MHPNIKAKRQELKKKERQAIRALRQDIKKQVKLNQLILGKQNVRSKR